MKEVSQEIVTKESGIDLKMEVSMEGETIIKRKADSLVGNFLRILYGMMGRTGSSDTRRMMGYYERDYRTTDGDENNGINNVEFDTDVYMDFKYDARLNDWNYVEGGNRNIFFLHANIPEIEGFYTIDSNDNFALYNVADVDPRTGTVTKGSQADWSGVDKSKWSGELWFSWFNFQTSWRRHDSFINPQIMLGRNSSDSRNADLIAQQSEVNIDDSWLRNWIAEFSTTGTSISQPAVATNSSEITFSRTFTNNRSYAIDVGEIGVRTKHFSYQDSQGLIARDVLDSSFTVSANSSVTIEYTITLSNDGGGGMMSQFHQQLYRQMQQTNRTVRDVNNNDKNDGISKGQWIAAATGGDQEQTAHNSQVNGQYIGPAPGVTTNPIANTNVSLGGDPSNENGQIPHGEADGELYYYGAVVEDLHQDTSNNEVWFDVSRLLENRGSTTIDVTETAHYNGHIINDYDKDYPKYSVMMARHILDAPVSVAPGEIFKLTYRFKVVV